MKTSRYRTCKQLKACGDPCPSCGSGLAVQTMHVRKGQPMSLATAHFFHAANAGVSVSTAKGDRRI